MNKQLRILGFILAGLIVGCTDYTVPAFEELSGEDTSAGDSDTDSDTDSDSDADSDTDSDTQGGTLPDCVFYVNRSATGNEDGSSWADAFDHPGAALAAADAAGDDCEVWVAAGTYYARDTAVTDTIAVPNGAQFYGGFSGSETYREQRNHKANVTILSGLDPLEQDHCRRVVTVDSGLLPTRIDGFVITDAYDGTIESAAGIFVYQGVLTVQNCVLLNNRDEDTCRGAAIEARETTIEILDSIFQNNDCYAWRYGEGGGAIYFGAAPAYGGATLERSAFVANRAIGQLGLTGGAGGGGILSKETPISIYSSLFVANVAQESDGGALSIDNVEDLAGVTLVKNAGYFNGAIQSDAANSAYGLVSWGNLTNDSSVGDHISDSISYTYSTVEGGQTGSGTYNVDADPLFAGYPSAPTGALESVVFDPARLQTTLTDDDAAWTPGHYAGQVVHVLGITPRWLYVIDNTATSLIVWEDHTGVATGTDYELYDFRLQAGSHCIDAGHGDFQTATDYYGNQRHNAPADDLGSGSPDYADHGAFEWIP